jgi:Asp-tRNA(Asn)/Glu-tRNA(Gln) amidotransferase A subunit family amidase
VEDYPKLLNRKDLKGVKIGIPKEYFIDGLDKGVEKVIREAIETMKKLGAETEEISLPYTEYAVATYYIIAPCEISANLARFDGIRFGPTVENPKDLIDMYFENRTKGFGDEVKRRIMLGTFRDRSKGIYYVRYIDPEIDNASKRDDGMFAKLAFWRSKKSQTSPQLQIMVNEAGEKSRVSVTGADGKAADEKTRNRILNLLHKELK